MRNMAASNSIRSSLCEFFGFNLLDAYKRQWARVYLDDMVQFVEMAVQAGFKAGRASRDGYVVTALDPPPTKAKRPSNPVVLPNPFEQS